MKKIIILMSALFLVLSNASFVHAGTVNTSPAKAPSVFDQPQKQGTKATCPVLENELTIDKNTQHSEYKGKYVYFCCPGCKPEFDKNPQKYLQKGKTGK